MKNSPLRIATVILSLGALFCLSTAEDTGSASKAENGRELLVTPHGVAPLAGVAIALPKDPDDSREYAWSLKLHVPKVIWDVVGKERPKREWSRIKADVEMVILEVELGYSRMTQLSEGAQNRVVDLQGRRLSREEALKRLAENTPVMVSVSGEMPDAFYLRSLRQDALIVLVGLPSSREYDLLPTSRATLSKTEEAAAR